MCICKMILYEFVRIFLYETTIVDKWIIHNVSISDMIFAYLYLIFIYNLSIYVNDYLEKIKIFLYRQSKLSKIYREDWLNKYHLIRGIEWNKKDSLKTLESKINKKSYFYINKDEFSK